MNRKQIISILVSVLALIVASLACGPGPSKPTVQVLAPPNGSQIAVGQTVEVQFRAEDAKAVAWVTMEVNGANVATLQSPVAEGQTPLEGILRWTPDKAGTFQLMLTANNAAGQNSDPAAVTIEVVEASAEVAQGNLEVQVDAVGNDELAVLAHSFNQMVSGLREGSLYRDLLGRTVSPEVREELRRSFGSGDVRLEGQDAVATVLALHLRRNQISPCHNPFSTRRKFPI